MYHFYLFFVFLYFFIDLFDNNNDDSSDDDSETFNNYETRKKYDLFCDYKLLKVTENIRTTMEWTKIIYDQMKDCKFHIMDSYTGFFCYISFMKKNSCITYY